MEEKLKESLNFFQVQDIVGAGRRLGIIVSTNIHSMSPDDLFSQSNYVLINYLSKPHYGHWVAMYYDRKNNTVNFFDSYGGEPDEQLDYIPVNYRMSSNQDYPNLLQLLYDWSRKDKRLKVEYNFKTLQHGKNTTCGRWCALYLALCDLTSIDNFGSAVKNVAKKNNISTDELVVILT